MRIVAFEVLQDQINPICADRFGGFFHRCTNLGQKLTIAFGHKGNHFEITFPRQIGSKRIAHKSDIFDCVVDFIDGHLPHAGPRV